MNSVEDLEIHLESQWDKLINETLTREDLLKGGGITHAHDIFSFTTNTNKMLGLEIDLKENKSIDQKLPQAKNWKIKINHNKIIMELKRIEFKDIFITTINKIISKIFLEKNTGHQALLSFIKNLDEHKNFFEDEGGPKILSDKVQIGLYGEIFYLNEILSKKINAVEANNYWTGPYKKHDFTTLKILLETKTSKSQSEKIINTSSEQINPNQDKPLYLVFLNINEFVNGKNLNDIINEIGKKIKEQNVEAYNDFCLKLIKVGYHEIHSHYYLQNYQVTKKFYYQVNKDFPYINRNEIEIPAAIEKLNLEYKINLNKCEQFLIKEEDFLNKI
jgi:hypothetical protein